MQVGVKACAVSEKYVMHGISAVQMFKAFSLRGVELLQGSSAIVQVGAGFGFQPQGLSVKNVKLQHKSGRRRWTRVVALAWRLVGGCVGLLPVSADLY